MVCFKLLLFDPLAWLVGIVQELIKSVKRDYSANGGSEKYVFLLNFFILRGRMRIELMSSCVVYSS